MENLDRQALLLAHLAGELPPEHRDRVEQMLAANPSVQAEFDALNAAYADVETALRAADSVEPLAVPGPAAARRFGREVRGWHARRMAAAQVAVLKAPARRPFQIPGWAYPVATAAIVILAYSAWWRFGPEQSQYAARDRQPDSFRMPRNMTDYPLVPPTAVADRYAYDFGAWATPNALADQTDEATELALSQTEAEVYALSDSAQEEGSEIDDVSRLLLLGEFE